MNSSEDEDAPDSSSDRSEGDGSEHGSEHAIGSDSETIQLPEGGNDVEVSQRDSLAPVEAGDSPGQPAGEENSSKSETLESSHSITVPGEEEVPEVGEASPHSGDSPAYYHQVTVAAEGSAEDEPSTESHSNHIAEQLPDPAESVTASSDSPAYSPDPIQTAASLEADTAAWSPSPSEPGFGGALVNVAQPTGQGVSEGGDPHAYHDTVHLPGQQPTETFVTNEAPDYGDVRGDAITASTGPSFPSEGLPDMDLAGHGPDGPDFLLQLDETVDKDGTDAPSQGWCAQAVDIPPGASWTGQEGHLECHSTALSVEQNCIPETGIQPEQPSGKECADGDQRSGQDPFRNPAPAAAAETLSVLQWNVGAPRQRNKQAHQDKSSGPGMPYHAYHGPPSLYGSSSNDGDSSIITVSDAGQEIAGQLAVPNWPAPAQDGPQQPSHSKKALGNPRGPEAQRRAPLPSDYAGKESGRQKRNPSEPALGARLSAVPLSRVRKGYIGVVADSSLMRRNSLEAQRVNNTAKFSQHLRNADWAGAVPAQQLTVADGLTQPLGQASSVGPAASTSSPPRREPGAAAAEPPNRPMRGRSLRVARSFGGYPADASQVYPGYDMPWAPPQAYQPGKMDVPYPGLPKPPVDLQPWVPPGSHVVKGKPSRTITSQTLVPTRPVHPSAFPPQMFGAPPHHLHQSNPYHTQQFMYPGQPLGPPYMQAQSHGSHASTRNAKTAPPQTGLPPSGYSDPWQSWMAAPVYAPPLTWGPTKPHTKAGAGPHKTPRVTDPVRMSYPPAAATSPCVAPGCVWPPGGPTPWGPYGPTCQPGTLAWPPAGAPGASRRASWTGGAPPAALPHMGSHGRQPGAAPVAALHHQLGQGGGRVDRETQRMQAVYQRQLERLKSLEESILDQMAARQQEGRDFGATGGRGWGIPHQQEFRVY